MTTEQSAIEVTPEELEAFVESSDGQPFSMINLIRFRAIANYLDKSDIVSGRKAYQRYLSKVKPLLDGIGARIIFCEKPNFVLVGSQENRWDLVLIVEYKNISSLSGMALDPEYLSIVHHRDAALEDYQLIRTPQFDAKESVSRFLNEQ